MREFKESDWKVLRKLRPIALERFCRSVLEEVERATADASKTYHERYLKVYDVIKDRDRELGRVFDDPRRSTAFMCIANLKALGLLTDEEYSQFSAEIRDDIEFLLR